MSETHKLPPTSRLFSRPKRDVLLFGQVVTGTKIYARFDRITWRRISRSICCEGSMPERVTADFLLARNGVCFMPEFARELSREADEVLEALEGDDEIYHEWATHVLLVAARDGEMDGSVAYGLADLRERLNDADIEALGRLRAFLNLASGFKITRRCAG